MRARRQSARGTRARDGTTKKLDGLCLGVYYFGSRWEDVIGTEAAGVKDWVGKGFMQGPTSCHMCTEKQHLIVSSLGRPQGKEEPRKGRKAYRLPPRGRGPPFPDGPLWHCGRERQFLSPKKYIPFDPGRSKKRNGPRSRNSIACICRSQCGFGDTVQGQGPRRVQRTRFRAGDRPRRAQTRTREAGCSSLRPNYR